MLKVVQALYLGIQIRIAFMETKSSTYYLDWLLHLALGLVVTLIILSSFFSEQTPLEGQQRQL